MTEEKQVAWLVTPKDAPVMGSAGELLGEVRAVLGDDDDDIFHGLAMKPDDGGKLVEVPGRASSGSPPSGSTRPSLRTR